MAVAFVQAASSAEGSGSALDISLSGVGSGHLLVVGVGYGSDTESVESVTDTLSNVYVRAIGPVRHASLGGDFTLEVWYAKNVAAGSPLISVGISGAGGISNAIFALELSGADVLTPADVSASATNLTDSSSPFELSTNIVPTVSGMGVALFISAPTPTPGTGWTQRGSRHNLYHVQTKSFTPGTQAVNATFSSSAEGSIAAVSFKELGYALAASGLSYVVTLAEVTLTAVQATNNGKLALINLGMPFQPSVYPDPDSTISQGDQQQLLHGFPENPWGTVTPSATGARRLLLMGVGS